MSSPNIRDLLTSFSPSLDYFAVASADGRIKIWETNKGQLQTEFADIAATDETGLQSKSERGHLSLDYKCMKWVQLERKKKRKVENSLLVLGTGNGDVLALDVSLGRLRWKVGDCHPGGVNAISFSAHNLCIYTAGVDGMVCQIGFSNGSMLGKFRSSTKAISALSISADGKILATAASQLKVFNCSNNKRIHKFSGHPVAVRCMIFSEDGRYILSSAASERYVAIWTMDDGSKQSACCVLLMEHPAVFLDNKTSEEGLYVLAISEAGVCYFWYGSCIDELKHSKATKISSSVGSSLSKNNMGSAIFAAKFHGVVRAASTSVSVAYGALIKPSFGKLMVQYGIDMDLNAFEDGGLLPIGQHYISQKGPMAQSKQSKVTTLDRANVEDAMLPLPKLHVHDKKRKHSLPHLIANIEKTMADSVVNNKSRTFSAHADVYPQNMEEDSNTCVEDMLKAAGILGDKDNLIIESTTSPAGIAADTTVHNGAHFSIDADIPTKKKRNYILSMNPEAACKFFEFLVSSWRTRSAIPKQILSWMYYLLVIHGQFIISQESSAQMFDALSKMTGLRCEASRPLSRLSGRLQLIMTQIDKAGQNMLHTPIGEHHANKIEDEDEDDDEDEDEDIDELVYGEEEDGSQSGSDDDF